MDSNKNLVLLLTIIFLSSLTTYQSANAKTTLETDNQYAIADSNAIIILSGNASNTTATYYPAHYSNIDGLYVPPFWEFSNFSTGNGTVDLMVSANNCNLTITSFSYLTRNGSEQYAVYTDSWLNYTIEGRGNQTVDYTYLYSSYSPTRNPDVYIDGVAKQQGDGWSGANIGITITGATSRVSIHQASADYFLPRNAPHLELIDYLLPISVTVTFVVIVSLLLFRRHRKATDLSK
jgi:hypothetical protein